MAEALEMVGPLTNYWHGFRVHLEELGYLTRPVECQLRLMAHLSQYMKREGLALGDLDDAAAHRFMAVRRAGPSTDRLSDKALVPLLGYLRSLGVLAEVNAAPPSDGDDQIIARYQTYLRHERGLVVSTVDCYVRYARLLLRSLAGRGGGTLGDLDAAAVIAFVAAEAGCRRVAAAKQLVNATRWFLRHLYVSGLVGADYSVVVPGVAGWQQTAIPKSVPPSSVDAALARIDRDGVTGRRDYALVYLIARLGLRASEAAALTLGDIDWQRGTISSGTDCQGRGARTRWTTIGR